MWVDLNNTLVNLDQIAQVRPSWSTRQNPIPDHLGSPSDKIFSIAFTTHSNTTIYVQFDNEQIRDSAFNDIKLILMNQIADLDF